MANVWRLFPTFFHPGMEKEKKIKTKGGLWMKKFFYARYYSGEKKKFSGKSPESREYSVKRTPSPVSECGCLLLTLMVEWVARSALKNTFCMLYVDYTSFNLQNNPALYHLFTCNSGRAQAECLTCWTIFYAFPSRLNLLPSKKQEKGSIYATFAFRSLTHISKK